MIIKHSDTPPHQSFIEYFKTRCDWDTAVGNVGLPESAELYPLPGLQNHEELLLECQHLLGRFPKVYWRSRNDRQIYGLSLTYNPSHPEWERHYASFGHPRYASLHSDRYYLAPLEEQRFCQKDDYLDSYGYREVLPEIRVYPNLSRLFNSFAFPVIRSTLRVIDGLEVHPTCTDFGGMHIDDPVHEMLRVNICLSNDGAFGFQYMGRGVDYMKPGEANVVNSSWMHRVFIKNRTGHQRYHLVIGLAPWMSYDSSKDAWSTNGYFGKIHPLDLVKDRLLTKEGY